MTTCSIRGQAARAHTIGATWRSGGTLAQGGRGRGQGGRGDGLYINLSGGGGGLVLNIFLLHMNQTQVLDIVYIG